MSEHFNENKDTDRAVLIAQLQEKLDWYIEKAPQEEFDEKAVESILYLLDTLQPVAEGKIPDVDSAWEKFEEMIAVRQCEDGNSAEESSAEESSAEKECREQSGAEKECVENSKEEAESEANEKRFNMKMRLASNRKGIGIAAAIILGLCLTIGGTMQVEALKSSGFFNWLKKDETGTQMITSPESLEIDTREEELKIYNDREKIPEDVMEWMQLWEKILENELYEWKQTMVGELPNFQMTESIYICEERDVVIGKIQYANRITMNTEKYIYIKSYYVEGEKLDIYSREEKNGEIYYYVCFWEDTCMHYVEGCNKVELLQEIAEKYLNLVKK